MNTARERVSVWVAYGAALWAAMFAVFHIVWAAGWYPLLDAEAARVGFATPWKWTFDVVVAGMCVIAVPVVLAPVKAWGVGFSAMRAATSLLRPRDWRSC